jgi:hypothetical protein
MKKNRNNPEIKQDCVPHMGFRSYMSFLSYQMEGCFQRAGDKFGE